ncbi:hypothetical protein [Streptomyces sp. LMG1-1-1.1]|uniref:hypothetical protein n=1 Tax=Streptomyces sp. LMG1-1-1.1 TaxID=3135245 RepID=UPI003465E400
MGSQKSPAAAGIDDTLVNGLGDVAGANGYGYGIDAGAATTLDQRRSPNGILADTCREVAPPASGPGRTPRPRRGTPV